MFAAPPPPPSAAVHRMQPSPPLSPPSASSAPLPHPRTLEPARKSRMYHNAVYYQYDGRSPTSVLEPQITSIVYYTSTAFDDHGRITLGNPGIDARDAIDGVPGGILRACTNMKRINSQLKVMLSIEAHTNDSLVRLLRVAASPVHRQTFATSARQLVDLYGLDGIDLDWGHPETREQGQDLQSLLHELRRNLQSPTYWLSVALAPNEWTLSYLDLPLIGSLVDLFNVMCFDFIPKNGPVTGHASALFAPDNHLPRYERYPDCHSSLQNLEARGVPMRKVMLGISSLGHIFHGATGPGQVYDKVSGIPYSQLPLAGSKETEDARLGLAYCVDEKRSRYATYDNRLTVDMKAHYVRQNGLAGVVLKQAGFDVRVEGLVSAAYRALHPVHAE